MPDLLMSFFILLGVVSATTLTLTIAVLALDDIWLRTTRWYIHFLENIFLTACMGLIIALIGSAICFTEFPNSYSPVFDKEYKIITCEDTCIRIISTEKEEE